MRFPEGVANTNIFLISYKPIYMLSTVDMLRKD
jgi:hypothetical protein